MKTAVQWVYYEQSTTLYDNWTVRTVPSNTLVGTLGRLSIYIYSAHTTIIPVKFARVILTQSSAGHNVVAELRVDVGGLNLEEGLMKTQREAETALFDFITLLKRNLLLLRKMIQPHPEDSRCPSLFFVDRKGMDFRLSVERVGSSDDIHIALYFPSGTRASLAACPDMERLKDRCTNLLKAIRMTERSGASAMNFMI